MNDDREWCEFEYKKGRRKTYVRVGLNPLEIWVEMKCLPYSAFLCACCDHTPLFLCKVGEKEKNESLFVNIEWVINDWGGDEEIVCAIKKLREDMKNKFELKKGADTVCA